MDDESIDQLEQLEEAATAAIVDADDFDEKSRRIRYLCGGLVALIAIFPGFVAVARLFFYWPRFAGFIPSQWYLDHRLWIIAGLLIPQFGFFWVGQIYSPVAKRLSKIKTLKTLPGLLLFAWCNLTLSVPAVYFLAVNKQQDFGMPSKISSIRQVQHVMGIPIYTVCSSFELKLTANEHSIWPLCITPELANKLQRDQDVQLTGKYDPYFGFWVTKIEPKI